MRDLQGSTPKHRRPMASSLARLLLAMSLLAPAAAQARAFQVSCSEAELRQAVEEAGFNGEEDVLWLARNCLYPMKGIVIAYPNGGLPITIESNGATINGQNQRTVFLVVAGATLFLKGLTVTEGKAGPTASGDGGAIYNAGALALEEVTVSDSQAYNGGGIYIAPDSSLTLLLSTVSGNTAGNDGGGIHNKEGRLTLVDSTVSGNSALGQSGVGAGIYNDEGRVTVSHCTLSHNTNLNGGNGSGIYHRNYQGAGFFRLGHSIVSDSQGNPYDCSRDPSLPSNPITPTGDNLVEDGSCQIAGAWSGDPKLGALSGKPAVRPLLPGTPVIDLLAQTAHCAGVDQRGAPRPKDGDGDGNGSALCDLGALEAP